MVFRAPWRSLPRAPTQRPSLPDSVRSFTVRPSNTVLEDGPRAAYAQYGPELTALWDPGRRPGEVWRIPEPTPNSRSQWVLEPPDKSHWIGGGVRGHCVPSVGGQPTEGHPFCSTFCSRRWASRCVGRGCSQLEAGGLRRRVPLTQGQGPPSLPGSIRDSRPAPKHCWVRRGPPPSLPASRPRSPRPRPLRRGYSTLVPIPHAPRPRGHFRVSPVALHQPHPELLSTEAQAGFPQPPAQMPLLRL